jgi:hypothetical protein
MATSDGPEFENAALNTIVRQNARQIVESTNDAMIVNVYLESDHERRISQGERDSYG